MNFQMKAVEMAKDITQRASAMAASAVELTRKRIGENAHHSPLLNDTMSTLRSAGGELNKMTRRHVSRLIEQNSSIAVDAGKDLSMLARATYARLTEPSTAARKPRKTAARKRTRKAA